MTACPSHAQQSGYLSIFKLNANTIKICSNLEIAQAKQNILKTQFLMNRKSDYFKIIIIT